MIRVLAVTFLIEAGMALPLWAQSPSPAPGAAPNQDSCLHGPREVPSEAARREEALQAMHLINRAVVESRMGGNPFPAWSSLGQASIVALFRGMAGAVGDLTRKMLWGADEPLPGWRIEYSTAAGRVRFSLTDVTDPCGFALSSEDPEVLPPWRPRLRLLESED